MATWITSKKFQGLSWKEHESRKYGGKPDRYYKIRYQLLGVTKTECIGWASAKGLSEQAAGDILSKLKNAQLTGEGAFTLAEQKATLEIERREKEAQELLEEKKKITFDNLYYNGSRVYKNRKEKSNLSNDSYYKKWIKPYIGDLPLCDIETSHLKTIKANCTKHKLASSSILSIFSIISGVFRYAIKHEDYKGKNIAGKDGAISLARDDNERIRFLSFEEVSILLSKIRELDEMTYEIALISVNTGMRRGEVLNLKWADVDLQNELITARDTKNKKTRRVPMTDNLIELFQTKTFGKPTDNVFYKPRGGKINVTPVYYSRAVQLLGFNEGITDRRDMVVFHTLRHTFASHLVQQGVDILRVSRLLGHTDIKTTQRYAHLSPRNFEVMKKFINGMKI